MYTQADMNLDEKMLYDVGTQSAVAVLIAGHGSVGCSPLGEEDHPVSIPVNACTACVRGYVTHACAAANQAATLLHSTTQHAVPMPHA